MKIKVLLCACFVFLAMCCCSKAYGYTINGNAATIQKGDTLWDIAANEFGDGQKWKQLAKLNKIKKPKKLRIGATIILHAKKLRQQPIMQSANIITDTTATTNHPEEKKDVAPLNINEENDITPPNITEKEEEETQTAETTTESTEPQSQTEIKPENSGNSAKLSYWQKFNIHGFLANETAFNIRKNALTKVKNILFFGKDGILTKNIGYKISGRAYYDAVYDLTSNYSKSVKRDQGAELELRDTYLDISAGPLDFRLGLQQIVWGEAAGLLPPANMVNSLDLREYILPWSFDQIRIPVFAVQAEYLLQGTHLEAVFIPWPKSHRLGVEGAEFAFPRPAALNGIPIKYNEPEKPAKTLKNSEIDFRISRPFNGYDFSLLFRYGRNHFPTNYRYININDIFNPVVDVKPEYDRQFTIGGTIAKSFENGIVIKGELINNQGGGFSINDISDKDGVVKKNYADYLVGVDYTFGNIDANFQLLGRYIPNYDPRMVDGRTNTSASIRLATDLLENKKLMLELLYIQALDGNGYLFRPKINYKLTEGLEIAVGLDKFGGGKNGLFGQFGDQSRVYSQLKLTF